MTGVSMTDDEFMAKFEACTLANAEFHHRDHVRMAFLYLSKYPALEAVERFSAALRRFAAANGKPGLYNETVTWAFLFLIRERMARVNARSWQEFADSNPDLLNWEQNILKKYYRPETLKSAAAKAVFILPDAGV